jgi:magnesium chelatase subunit I
VNEVIERIAFAARDDKKIDKRSGVSQRLPISAMENVVSNAERRAIRITRKLSCRASATSTPPAGDHRQARTRVRGRAEGRRHVSRELIRTAVAKTYDTICTASNNMNQVVQWFDLGGEIQFAR